jgi:predicted ATPase
MTHLRRALLADPGRREAGFPFDLPVLAGGLDLSFEAPVTIFVGENGSGKSTLLEALAIAAHAISAGSEETGADATLDGARALAGDLRLTWSKRPGRGFFMRAEDFFGYARRLDATRAGLEAELRRIDVEYADASLLARDLARSPMEHELAALRARYGDGLDTRSHGESFLHFFRERIVPGGIYFLDEPEAPLSPARQLALLALLKAMVAEDVQVVMATHSPILLAAPDAVIWTFDTVPMSRAAYGDLDHVTLTRDFLRDPEAYLRHL